MHYGRRVDKVQPEIVKELRSDGYSVILTSRAGGDAPDVIVGKYGLTVMGEIKSREYLRDHKARQARQQDARDEWAGGSYIMASCAADFVAEFDRLRASLAQPPERC